MPFTPFHMGPGLLVKALLQGSFSLMVFGWTQIVHADLEPFFPVGRVNPMLGLISVEALHRLCLYSGLLGLGLYFAIAHWLSRQGRSGGTDVAR